MKLDQILARVRATMHERGMSPRTEEAYLYWIGRFVQHHDYNAPETLGADHVRSFVQSLERRHGASPATRNLALNAVRFLYRRVLERPMAAIENVKRAHQERGLPEVFTRAEARAIINGLQGQLRLMAGLIYGSGLRLAECVALRVRDLDFESGEIVVRNVKDGTERRTVLPASLAGPLREHLATVRELHRADIDEGYGAVDLPINLAASAANTARAWRWQYVFPASRRVRATGSATMTRHHVHESVLQRAIQRAAVPLDTDKHASPRTLRHSFAAHMLEDGFTISAVQELLGHSDARSTMIYTSVLAASRRRLRSPLDGARDS